MRGAVAAMLLLAVGGAAWRLSRRTPALMFADGSYVEALDPATRVAAREDQPHHTTVALLAGRARFDVVPNQTRSFRVEAGSLAVWVLGTRFEVTRGERSLGVRVERGHVRVMRGEAQLADLQASQAVEVPYEAPAEAPAPARAGSPDELPQAEAGDRAAAAPVERPNAQRARAATGAAGEVTAAAPADPGPAPEATAPPRPASTESAAALLHAADDARLKGDTAEATGLLTRLLAEHPRSPEAVLAAFSLGRLLLDGLDRADEAAEAFATAHRLAPTGPLAGDALAREVESWSRAGRVSEATRAARAYLAQHPNGPHSAQVRRWGRLE